MIEETGKMIEYKIIQAEDVYELERRVNEALRLGWALYGSPLVGFTIYMQPMTRQY